MTTATEPATGGPLDLAGARALAALLSALDCGTPLCWSADGERDPGHFETFDLAGLVDAEGKPWPDTGADVLGAYVAAVGRGVGSKILAQLPMRQVLDGLAAGLMWYDGVAVYRLG